MKRSRRIDFLLGSMLVVVLITLGSVPGIELAASVATPEHNGITTLISHHTDGTQGNSVSFRSSISSDGRYVAFVSKASNLVDDDTNDYPDVFVNDRQTGETTLISRRTDGTLDKHRSDLPSISADGRYVAFYSDAFLSDDDNIFQGDIFFHDRQTGETTLISRHTNGTQGIGSSVNPSISANGRFIAFYSQAENLVDDDPNPSWDAFVHDRQTGETSLVSHHTDGARGNSDGSTPSISANGRFVAYSSLPVTQSDDDSTGVSNVFVHDRQTDETTLVSSHTDGTPGNGDSLRSSISADGRIVAFHSYASNLVDDDTNGSTGSPDIFVKDRQTGETTLVSRHTDGTQGSSFADHSSISADGRFVAFTSGADFLVDDDTGFYGDTFMHDRQTGETILVSRHTDGTLGNGDSRWASISADGNFITYYSYASNLVDDDTNFMGDIFVRDLEISVAPATPFLDLPIEYDKKADDPEIILLGNYGGTGGRINSWFDHDEPRWHYNFNDEVQPWHGLRLRDLLDDECIYGLSCYDTHDGIDFQKTSVDDRIVAAAAGDVVKIGGLGLGNSVVIDHNNGYATVYGHLDSINPDLLGASSTNPITITLRADVGEVGATGCPGCGEHLHFEVRYDPDGVFPITSKVDPFGWGGIGEDPAFDKGYVASPRGGLWLWSRSTYDIPVDETGGFLNSSFGNTSIWIPPGALNSLLGWSFIDLPSFLNPGLYLPTPWNFWFYTLPWEIDSNQQDSLEASESTSNGQFNIPVTISIGYTDEDIEGLNENSLVIGQWNDTNQVLEPIPTIVDTTNNVVTAETLTSGRFGLIGLPLCSNDLGEFDNNDAHAKGIIIEQPTQKIFSTDDDVDWMRTDVVAGTTYVLNVSNLTGGANLMVTVSDGHQILISGSGEGDLTFVASTDRVFIEAVSQTTVTNCSSGYTVTLGASKEERDSYIYLPMIIGR